MKLESIELTQFRNYRKLTFKPGERVNLLIGQNAQGKTNLLEAIALLMRGRSRRVRTRTDILMHGEKECRVSGRFRDDRALDHDVALAIDTRGERRIQLDGQKLERTSRLFETLPCVLQESTDLEMLSGPPAARRAFLDMLCLELSARYIPVYARHERLLRGRNILVARKRRGAELDVMTRQFCAASGEVMMTRLEAVRALSKAIALLPASEREEDLVVRYEITGAERDWEPASAGEAASWLAAKLAGRLEEDLQARTTGLGPQRDDLKLILGARPVKNVASRGQLKDVLLRIKIGEAMAIRVQREEMPVLLLDDAFSETDEVRRRQMIEWLPREAQIFLTGTDRGLGKEFEEGVCRGFRVRKGTIDASEPL